MNRLDGLMRQAGIPLWGVCPMPPEDKLLPCRGLGRLPENACRVLICAFPYDVGEQAPRNLSRYAVVPDYHRVLFPALEGLVETLRQELGGAWAAFVDSSPIPEVSCAVRAGLGVRGKNGLLITREYGSYVFLGELVTDLPLDCSAPAEGSCLSCGACQRVCPGRAILDGRVEAARCLSQITQKKGKLTPWEEDLIRQGGLLWGCDRCQEVCPHNRGKAPRPYPPFGEDIRPWLSWEEIGSQCKERAFGFRGPGVLRRNYRLLYEESFPEKEEKGLSLPKKDVKIAKDK